MTNSKNIKEKKIETCIDCLEKTTDFYISSINSGKIARCKSCHELWVIRSIRNDARTNNSDQIKD